MADKCPKCGSHDILLGDGAKVFDCGTVVNEHGVICRETEQCLRNQLAQRDARIAELEAVTDTLPRNASGDIVTLGSVQWALPLGHNAVHRIVVEGVSHSKHACTVWGEGRYQDTNVVDCYSTQEAAEAARKDGAQ